MLSTPLLPAYPLSYSLVTSSLSSLNPCPLGMHAGFNTFCENDILIYHHAHDKLIDLLHLVQVTTTDEYRSSNANIQFIQTNNICTAALGPHPAWMCDPRALVARNPETAPGPGPRPGCAPWPVCCSCPITPPPAWICGTCVTP